MQSSTPPFISLSYNNEDYVATEENAFDIILSTKKQDTRGMINKICVERTTIRVCTIQKNKTSSCVWNKSILDHSFVSLFPKLSSQVTLPL